MSLPPPASLFTVHYCLPLLPTLILMYPILTGAPRAPAVCRYPPAPLCLDHAVLYVHVYVPTRVKSSRSPEAEPLLWAGCRVGAIPAIRGAKNLRAKWLHQVAGWDPTAWDTGLRGYECYASTRTPCGPVLLAATEKAHRIRKQESASARPDHPTVVARWQPPPPPF